MTEQNRDDQTDIETAAETVTEDAGQADAVETDAQDDGTVDAEADEDAAESGSDENVEEAEVVEETPVDEAPQQAASEQKAKDQTDWKDAYVRLAADFDNYRKRTAKEFDDVRKREREKVIGTWLDVYDNTERAIAALPEKEGPWYEGFQQIIKQMDNCLATFGIKAADDMGKPFDAKRHEAIAILPNPALENNTIMHVERKGFVYENGDVARVARVVVVRNPS